MKIAVLFPGQGSQFLGMGQEFIESNPRCSEIMSKTESVCDAPIGKLCQEGPMEELTRAKYLQPAITAINLICWKSLQEALGERCKMSFFAGHSLGEYSALHAAGVISVEDTIRLVAQRGKLMDREGQLNPGGMRAILGLSINQIEEMVIESKGSGIVTVANHNTDQQIVISGDMEGLDFLSKKAEIAGAKVIPLNVSVANHSPLVANAVPDFREYMKSISFSTPEVPVIFNVTTGPENDPDKIKEIMANQIASKVNWFGIINRMIEEGVDTFIEVGPKTVLKGLMRKILPKGGTFTTLQFDSPDSLKICLEKLDQ